MGTIFGFIFTAMNVGSGVGALVAGLDQDITGNYQAALIANVALGFLAAIATWSIKVRPFEIPQTARRAITESRHCHEASGTNF